MEGAGLAAVAVGSTKDAIVFGHELLDGREGLEEAQLARSPGQPETASRSFFPLDDACPGQLAEELAEVVRRGSRRYGDGLGIGIATFLEDAEVGEGLERVDGGPGEDDDLLKS